MKNNSMKRGRPPKAPGKIKSEYLDIRLEASEKRAFRDAAELAGLDLSAWIRERLRSVSRKELERAGRPVAFMNKQTPMEGNDGEI